MCHTSKLSLCTARRKATRFDGVVSARCYETSGGSAKIAVLPDIYGLTPFYKDLSSMLAERGGTVCLVNLWEPFGELPEMTREAAWERRHLLRDRSFCDDLASFVGEQRFDAIVGFCIGGNFLLELVRRGYRGTSCAFYPLPWGMPNEDGLQPPFEYMERLNHQVTILMGEQDVLAGPDNIERLQAVCAKNPALDLHLYRSSGHGFLADVDSADEDLRRNARAALDVLIDRVLPEPSNAPPPATAPAAGASVES